MRECGLKIKSLHLLGIQGGPTRILYQGAKAPRQVWLSWLEYHPVN